jgi:hypothetical protein
MKGIFHNDKRLDSSRIPKVLMVFALVTEQRLKKKNEAEAVRTNR